MSIFYSCSGVALHTLAIFWILARFSDRFSGHHGVYRLLPIKIYEFLQIATCTNTTFLSILVQTKRRVLKRFKLKKRQGLAVKTFQQNSDETSKMPTDSCQYFYECKNCHVVLKAKSGDCCVFCSYGTVQCPPIQKDSSCCQ